MEYCPECGAPVPDGGSCRDNFDAPLLLESQIPGRSDYQSHFYAVTSYILQHPDTMNYKADAFAGARQNLADMLDGTATIYEVRQRMRRAADGPTRVVRRPGDPVPTGHTGTWPVTIADVLSLSANCDPTATDYAAHVLRWAQSIRQTLATEENGV